MRLRWLRPCPSQPMLALLLSLALLVHLPGARAHPRLPAAFLPKTEHPDWEAALLQLQASLGVPWGPPPAELGDPRLAPLLRELAVEQAWGEGGRRGGGPLGPFPGYGGMGGLHYQEGGEGEGEGGGERNEALTSIARGLQAFNREKGGFGFRFGRK